MISLRTLITVGAAVMFWYSPGNAQAVPAAHLAPGDDVTVVVFREAGLSARVFVDDRGQITLPKLGLLNVGSLTADMLRDSIRTRYATILRDPSVDVRALRRVTVNGAVVKPDVYFVDPGLTLRDVIARSGGITPDGDIHKVSLVRGTVVTRYPDWAESDQGRTPLVSGDEIVVGRRSWASLNLGALVGIGSVITSLAIAFVR